jgi:hypothetical protein
MLCALVASLLLALPGSPDDALLPHGIAVGSPADAKLEQLHLLETSNVSNVTVVALDFQSNTEFVFFMAEECSHYAGCSLHVVNKNGTCDVYSQAGISCETVAENLGRDAGSALYYVINHYEDLPERVVVVPTSEKWGRFERFKRLLNLSATLDDPPFDCASDSYMRTVYKQQVRPATCGVGLG